MKAFFTGHRWIDDNWRKEINKLIDYALSRGVKHFYSGMALGTDLLAAECLIRRNLDWTAVIPCRNQDELWKLKERNRYARVLKTNPKQIILYDYYSPGVMQARNLWMIKRSDLCLSIYTGKQSGGTAMTVQTAAARGIPVVNINPLNHDFCLFQSRYQQLSLFEFDFYE
ncbi:SLOG family protein [Microcoleus sp. FACHB-672]|uniref:SLOG family protein n=1 Tax=Microcoleus sp. FACHB-672 TaxID=2692825 RepID=UPI001682E008|nr:SLOG family protein [Microcoleus sp. FACHB-672]MBD2039236.1 DUF1273 family protein [Microcoleus sp. FACHB-672]